MLVLQFDLRTALDEEQQASANVIFLKFKTFYFIMMVLHDVIIYYKGNMFKITDLA